MSPHCVRTSSVIKPIRKICQVLSNMSFSKFPVPNGILLKISHDPFLSPRKDAVIFLSQNRGISGPTTVLHFYKLLKEFSSASYVSFVNVNLCWTVLNMYSSRAILLTVYSLSSWALGRLHLVTTEKLILSRWTPLRPLTVFGPGIFT